MHHLHQRPAPFLQATSSESGLTTPMDLCCRHLCCSNFKGAPLICCSMLLQLLPHEPPIPTAQAQGNRHNEPRSWTCQHECLGTERLARSFSDRYVLKSPGSWTSAPWGHGCPHRQALSSGLRKRVVSKRVVLADVPGPQNPERGYRNRCSRTKKKPGTRV